jgi:hypothetical protein
MRQWTTWTAFAALATALGCGAPAESSDEVVGEETLQLVRPLHHIDLDPLNPIIEARSAIVLTAIPRDANNFFAPFTGEIVWEIIEGGGSLAADGLFVTYTAPPSNGTARVRVRFGGLEATSTITVVTQPQSTEPHEWDVGSCDFYFEPLVRLDSSDPSRNIITFRNWTGEYRVIYKVIGWVGEMPETHRPAELREQVVSEAFAVAPYPGTAEISIPTGMGTWQNNQWSSTISYDTWRCAKKVFGTCVLPKFVTRSYSTNSKFNKVFVYHRKVGDFGNVFKCSLDGLLLP